MTQCLGAISFVVRIFLLTSLSASLSFAATKPKPLTSSVKRGTISLKIDSEITPLNKTLVANFLSISGPDISISEKSVGQKFSFKAPNGVSAIVVRSEALRSKRSYQPLALALFVGSKSLQARSAEPTLAARSGARVSVGGIKIRNSDGTLSGPIPGGKGPFLADSTFIGDLVNDPTRCGKVVLDRDFDPAYKAVIKELKLGSSRSADPRFRKDFAEAIATLQNNAPQFRLTGEFTQLGKSRNGSAHLELVDLSNGAILWEKNYFGSQSMDLMSRDAASEVWQELCSAQVPRTISGNFQGHDSGNTGQIWSGNFQFQIDPAYENLTFAELVLRPSVPYLITGLSANWEEHGTYGTCRTTAMGSHTWTAAELGSSAPLQLRILEDQNSSPLYYLVFGLTAPNIVPQFFECDGGSTFNSTTSWGVFVFSDLFGNFLPFSSDGVGVGSTDDGTRHYDWSLQVEQRFTPRQN